MKFFPKFVIVHDIGLKLTKYGSRQFYKIIGRKEQSNQMKIVSDDLNIRI